jgi:dTDP-4-dehydrorhamnose reductase
VRLGRVLITGGGGQLASDLGELLGHADVRSRESLDIADDRAVERAFDEARPELVFNCAAFHNVGVCEQEEDRSFEVNARAVKRLAERSASVGAKLVHFSTNYVFDGSAKQPYAEDDLPNPRSVYAISKLSGEYMARSYCPGALVVRSAGLYGLYGSASKGGNFITRVLGRARDEGRVTMVSDQRLQPTFTADLAAALIEAVEASAEGVLHRTNSGECSWYEFTQAIMEIAGLEDVPVEPVATTRQPGAPDRPLNGVLARPAADAAGLQPLRAWRDALADYMERAGLSAASSAEPLPR